MSKTIEKTKQELLDDLALMIANVFSGWDDTIRIKAAHAIIEDVFPASPVNMWQIRVTILVDDQPDEGTKPHD